MTALLFYPAFKDRNSFHDQLFRAVWHFLPMAERIHHRVFLYTGEDYQEIEVNEILSSGEKYLPADFDPAIAQYATQYIDHVTVLKQEDSPKDEARRFSQRY